MIPLIVFSTLAFLFGGVAGVVVLRAGLLVIAFGGALVILAWKSVKFTVFGTWRLACFVLWAAWRVVVGVLKLARFVVMAFVHVGGDLARVGR